MAREEQELETFYTISNAKDAKLGALGSHTKRARRREKDAGPEHPFGCGFRLYALAPALTTN